MPDQKIVMKHDKSTKNTHRFVGGTEGVNGTIYLGKHKLGDRVPEEIQVIVVVPE